MNSFYCSSYNSMWLSRHKHEEVINWNCYSTVSIYNNTVTLGDPNFFLSHGQYTYAVANDSQSKASTWTWISQLAIGTLARLNNYLAKHRSHSSGGIEKGIAILVCMTYKLNWHCYERKYNRKYIKLKWLWYHTLQSIIIVVHDCLTRFLL